MGDDGGTAPEALAPGTRSGLAVQREEEALLLGDVDAAVADRRRELERVVRVDRPQPLVRRAVVVGRDMRALVVVAEGRPRPAGRPSSAAASAPAPRSSRTPPWPSRASQPAHLRLQAYRRRRDRDDDHDEPAAQQQASSGHRGAGWQTPPGRPSAASAAAEHAPDALCHFGTSRLERRLLELARPLGRPAAQHDPVAEAGSARKAGSAGDRARRR